MRTDDTLSFLEKRGKKGVSAEEFGKKFKFQKPGSISKTIGILRDTGHDIPYDKERGVFVLKKKADETPEDQEGNSFPEEEEDTPIFPREGKPLTKKELILDAVIEAGKTGASAAELSKISGVGEGNVCYHIHSLRKTDGYKISMVNGRYVLKSRTLFLHDVWRRQHAKYQKSAPETPADTNIVDNLIIDQVLFNGINKISPADRSAYVDLLKKVIYYKKCAQSMLETTSILETLSI